MGARVGWGLSVLVVAALLGASPARAEENAEALTQQASHAKTPEEAAALLKRATELAPNQAATHLNYAGALFALGQRVLAAGNTEQGTAMFRDAEKELLTVIRLAKNESDPRTRQPLKSQSAFLLGEAYYHVFKDKLRAKRYYQDSLWYDPQHPGALEARKLFNEE